MTCKKVIQSKSDLVIANGFTYVVESITFYLITYHKNCFDYQFPKNTAFRPVVIEKEALDNYKFLDYICLSLGLSLVFIPIILPIMGIDKFNLLVYIIILLVIVTPAFYFPLNNMAIRKKVKALSLNK